MKTFNKLLWVLFLVNVSVTSLAQISAGHIIYERKTNLYKKYKDPSIQRYIPETEKSKVDAFELYFNDSLSYFGPQENDLKEMMSWTTSKNKVYQNFKTGELYTIKDVWGEESHVIDTVRNRTWKIIPGKRKICGYDCQKALWQPSDSINIYAWFCNDLTTSTGPESFTGLPGVILGLATEDGGVIYFAKQVLLERIDPLILQPKKTKSKVYQTAELKAKLSKDFGKEVWGKLLLDDLFGIW